MGLFDFVENFFFIGLALLFVLVLLLVYHFKQRMNSVEKKGDNMYDLLTNVVRELRNIRTNVMGGESVQEKPALENIQPVHETIGYSDIEEDSGSESGSEDGSEEDDEETREDGITYQIIDSFSNKRMVVSDESYKNDSSSDSDSDSDTDSDDDLDEDNTSQTEMYSIPVETYTEDVPLETDDICDISRENVDATEETDPLEETETKEDAEPKEDTDIPLNVEKSELVESLTVDTITDIQPISRNINEKVALYKKMNVNQLKALAIQHGIQGDTSKLKKTTLIDFLIEKEDMNV